MKKVFSIISVCLVAVIVAFVSTLCFVKTNNPLVYGTPYYINVYNHSTSSIGNKSFEEDDENFNQILTELKNITNVSIFNRLIGGGNLTKQIEQETDGKYVSYSTDLKQDNIVVELIFNKSQDAVVYSNGNSRVISYFCILYVIPDTDKLDEILVYHSTTADSTNSAKDKAYAACEPFVLYGNPSSFSKFVKTLG